jgi:hypothetical protein
MAAVLYHPAQTGQQTIKARFKGDQTFGPTEASLVLDVAEIIPPFESEPVPLASVGKWLSFGLGLLGVAFWAVLLGVLGRTVRGIRAAAGSAPLRAGLASQTAETPRQEVM